MRYWFPAAVGQLVIMVLNKAELTDADVISQAFDTGVADWIGVSTTSILRVKRRLHTIGSIEEGQQVQNAHGRQKLAVNLAQQRRLLHPMVNLEISHRVRWFLGGRLSPARSAALRIRGERLWSILLRRCRLVVTGGRPLLGLGLGHRGCRRRRHGEQSTRAVRNPHANSICCRSGVSNTASDRVGLVGLELQNTPGQGSQGRGQEVWLACPAAADPA